MGRPAGDIIGDDENWYWFHRVGRLTLLWGRKHQSFPKAAMVGPDWPCMLVTYGLMIGPTLAYIIIFSSDGQGTAALVSACTLILLLTTYSFAACTDPGIVYSHPGDAEEGESREEDQVMCGKCEVVRPEDAMHCSSCGVCIKKHDHHCPWTGTCIGSQNLIAFYAFLVCLTVHLAWLAISFMSSPIRSGP
ncbi:unnamed protein product [Chrysoparadoxa australica]